MKAKEYSVIFRKICQMFYFTEQNQRVLIAVFFVCLLIQLFYPARVSAQNIDSVSNAFLQKDVSFHNADVQLSGTLFLPNRTEKMPAVVILHGSGPDEGLEYRVYAEEFARAGIATLVYDKRGWGKSGGDWHKRPFNLLAGDALAAVEFLQNQPQIDSTKVGLWGISQGGWTAAFAAAHSKNVAFVVSVAGNAVSPTQQELFHRDNMYQNLGYSDKARRTASKFWQLVFDWLVLVDEGKFPLPKGLLESELSGASVGLDYDSLPDWANIHQPVLLIHGEHDELSPAKESISRIGTALKKNDNRDFTYQIFPGASHTITTNQTGLVFDWDDHFAPGYFDFTTGWILSRTGGKPIADKNESSSEIFQPSADFDNGGRFGAAPFYGRAYPQLLLMVIFPLSFLFGGIASMVALIRRKRTQPQQKSLKITLTTFAVCLTNLILLGGFYDFLATSIFPQGMSLMTNYHIPGWQKSLPWLGIINTVLTAILLVVLIRNRANVKRWQWGIIFFAVIFIPWLYYWNLIGAGF